MHPHRADWGTRASAGRHRAAALVLVLHALLLLAWLQHTGRIKVSTHAPASRTTLSWVLPAAPPATTAPPPPSASPQQPSTAPAAQPAVPRERPKRPAEPSIQPITPAPSTTLSLLPAASAPETPAPSSTPMGALLRNEATREALRQTGQQALLAERAEAATGIAIQRQDTALAEGVKQGAKGDCLKGEFAGSGGGLLSLPALAYAAAAGKCAK
jgi:type IV secretory pathway VirB10-like protein